MRHPESCYYVECPDTGVGAYIHSETKHDARDVLREMDWATCKPTHEDREWRSPWSTYNFESHTFRLDREEPSEFEILEGDEENPEHVATF